MQTLDQLFATAEADILKAPMAVTANPLSRAVEDFNLFGGHSDRGVMGGIAEQYAHVISAAYSAISLVSKRAADQPAFVGKLTNNPSKGRSLKDHVAKGRITVPQHLKSINPENVEVIEDHPLVAAMNDPNEIHCRFNMMFQTFWSIQATGRANWMAMQKDGRYCFYYLPAQWCTPIHTGQRFYDHWKVQPPGSTKDPVKVPRELMSYFHLPDPADPFGVIAPMQRMSRTIIADQEIEKSQEVVFRNGMMPIYAVTTGDGMSETFPGGGGTNMPELETHQRQQIWSMIQRQYTGAIKHGLPIILDALLRDVKRISETPDKMAFQEAGQMTEGRVYKGFGVNPISAGQVEGANRASSAVADHHLVSNSINPMLNLASQVITKRTAPLFAGENERLVFWFQPAVAFDPEQEQLQWEWASNNQAVTRNEIRSRINLPPLDGEDELPEKPSSAPPVMLDDEPEEEADDKAFRDRYIKTATQMWLKQHQREENEYSKAIQGYLAEIRKSVVAKFREAFKGNKSSASDLTELIFPAHEWDQKLLDTTRPHIQRALLAGAMNERALVMSRTKKLSNGMVAYRQKGWRKDVEGDIEDFQVDIPPETLVEINGILGETMEQPYWQAINKTVQNRILKTISDGLIEGMSNIEIANLLDLTLEGVEGSSSLAIARTEITNALNGGIHAVQQDLAKDGLISGAEWLTVGDGDVRGSDPQDSHDHVSANHQKVKAGDNFVVSGEETPWPAHFSMSAGNRINCRCVKVSLFEGTVPEGALPEAEY